MPLSLLSRNTTKIKFRSIADRRKEAGGGDDKTKPGRMSCRHAVQIAAAVHRPRRPGTTWPARHGRTPSAGCSGRTESCPACGCGAGKAPGGTRWSGPHRPDSAIPAQRTGPQRPQNTRRAGVPGRNPTATGRGRSASDRPNHPHSDRVSSR